MRKYLTLQFLDYAGERALKTVLQALFAGGVIGAGIFGLNWTEISTIAGGTAIASIATSVLVYRGDGSDDPSDTIIGPIK